MTFLYHFSDGFTASYDEIYEELCRIYDKIFYSKKPMRLKATQDFWHNSIVSFLNKKIIKAMHIAKDEERACLHKFYSYYATKSKFNSNLSKIYKDLRKIDPLIDDKEYYTTIIHTTNEYFSSEYSEIPLKKYSSTYIKNNYNFQNYPNINIATQNFEFIQFYIYQVGYLHHKKGSKDLTKELGEQFIKMINEFILNLVDKSSLQEFAFQIKLAFMMYPIYNSKVLIMKKRYKNLHQFYRGTND